MPRLALITTGGTIAGAGPESAYTAGALSAAELFAAVPGLDALADWHLEQAFNGDSRDFTPAHWLALAACVQRQLADPAIDGVLITHGTDTLEETACALHFLLPRGKPVVLTAAMRPATALSPDGPGNLWQAACVAADPRASGHGPLIVAQGAIIRATDFLKQHTLVPSALAARPGTAALGWIAGTSCQLPPAKGAAPALMQIAAGNVLPRVDILHAHAGAAADLIDACIALGSRGLVLALSGHGSVPQAWLEALRRARSAGVTVVRASRIAEGGVWRNHNADDDGHGWLAAGQASPVQARVLLTLGLAEELSSEAIQALLLSL